MKFVLRELTESALDIVGRITGEFVIDSQVVLRVDGDRISYTAVPIPETTKDYQPDHLDYGEYITNPDKAIFMADVNGRPAGMVVLRKGWNNYGYIDYIVVDREFRGGGIGRALMDRAKEWAAEKGLGGLMLETQNNNLKACRFYESCGFQIGGFDKFLYKAQDAATDEVAIFWYFLFDS